jgi:hypothetical protein
MGTIDIMTIYTDCQYGNGIDMLPDGIDLGWHLATLLVTLFKSLFGTAQFH